MEAQMNRHDYLKIKHKELHDKIEALEAEKAPEKYIIDLKKQKLQVKTELNSYDNKTNIHI